MLMRLRMLKLSVGKGHQVINQLCRAIHVRDNLHPHYLLQEVCSPYLPEDQGDSEVYGKIQVKLVYH